jgi:hypothetical protein
MLFLFSLYNTQLELWVSFQRALAMSTGILPRELVDRGCSRKLKYIYAHILWDVFTYSTFIEICYWEHCERPLEKSSELIMSQFLEGALHTYIEVTWSGRRWWWWWWWWIQSTFLLLILITANKAIDKKQNKWNWKCNIHARISIGLLFL